MVNRTITNRSIVDRTGRVRAWRAGVALVVSAVLVTGCGDDDGTAESASTESPGSGSEAGTEESGYPVTVESCGTDYTFEGPPEQVLLGWPYSMETLMALGVEDTLIGYLSGGLSELPEGAPDVPEVSPDFTASREVVISAGADLLLLNDLNAVSGESGGVSLDDLRSAGTDVFVLGDYCGSDAPTSTDVVIEDIVDLGDIFGVPDRAEQLTTEIDGRLAEAATGDNRSTAFVQVNDGTLYALSGTSYEAVLDAVGLDNIFADLDGNFSEISAETVLTLAPEVIVVVYDDMSTDAPDAIAEISDLLQDSPAVADGNIVPITYSAMSASGITLIDIIEDLAAEI